MSASLAGASITYPSSRKRGAGGDVAFNAHLGGDDPGEGGFPEAGRA